MKNVMSPLVERVGRALSRPLTWTTRASVASPSPAAPTTIRAGVPRRPASAVTTPRASTTVPTARVRTAAIVCSTGLGLGVMDVLGSGVGVGSWVVDGDGVAVGAIVGVGSIDGLAPGVSLGPGEGVGARVGVELGVAVGVG